MSSEGLADDDGGEEELEEEGGSPSDLVPVLRNQCPHCFVQFTLEKNYVDHMWTAHGSKRPFRCDDCGIFLSYRSSLYNHKKIHSDKRPFACSDCSAKFRWNNSLKYHMARAHQKVAIITAKQVTATAPLPAPLPSSAVSKAQATTRRTHITTAIDTVLQRVKEEESQRCASPTQPCRTPEDLECTSDGAWKADDSSLSLPSPSATSPDPRPGGRKRKSARPSRIAPSTSQEPAETEEDDEPGSKRSAEDARTEILEEIQRQQGCLLAQMEAFETWMKAQFETLNASIALLAQAPLLLNGHS